jgi:hypothetical protein
VHHVSGTRHVTQVVLLNPNLTQIFSGRDPWGSAGWAIVNYVLKGDRPPDPGNIKAQYWKLIEQCWAALPNSRLKIGEVLQRLY